MKTMIKDGDIIRVQEKQVSDFLERGYEYCPKKLWKDEVRVLKEKKEEIREKVEGKSTKRGKRSKN